VATRKYFQIYRSDTVAKHLNEFNNIYPNAIMPPRHNEFIKLHAFPYLRALEVLNLSAITNKPKYVFEIGAGACTNIAILRDLYQTKSLVVDLPDTIFAGYLFLKSFFPDMAIALPQDIDDGFDIRNYDVVFLLPYQVDLIPGDFFDIAYNMSSFQEMEMEVTNNYISLIHRVLKKGGHIILSNQQVSRYIKGNSFENYRLNNFIEGVKKNPKFQNFGIRDIHGLEQFFYQAKKA